MKEYYTNGYVSKDSLAVYVILMGVVMCMGGIGHSCSKYTKHNMPVKQHQVADSNLVTKVTEKNNQ